MAASALDMALEDVIKTKGGRRNNTRGVKKQALKEKPKQVAKKAPAKSEAGGAAAARPSALGSLRFAKGAAARAFGVAAKAAAAAAKATSTTTTPAAAAGAKRSSAAAAAPAAARKTGGGRSNAGATAGSPVKGTEAKLSMTLEDMIKSTSKKKPAAKAKAAGASRKGAGQQGAAAGPRQRLKLRSQGLAKKVAAKAKAKAKGKAKAKAKGKTVQAEGKGKGKGGGGRGAESLWEDAWAMWRPMGKGKSKGKGKSWAAPQGLDWGVGRDDSWRKGGAGKGGWEGAAGFKRKAAFNDWDAMPAKRNRTSMHDIRASYGWGHDDERGDDIPRSRREVDRVARSTAMAWERERQWTRGAGGGGRMASDWEPPTNRQVREVRGGTITSARSATARNIASAGCRIKVTNVPRNLSNTDIQEAFEDVGIVKSCRLGTNGVAYITFNKAQDAKKAQTTFDRGELNNQMIYVSLCD